MPDAQVNGTANHLNLSANDPHYCNNNNNADECLKQSFRNRNDFTLAEMRIIIMVAVN